jgi:hypothetical protein
MECPAEVESLLLKIVGIALVNIRGVGFLESDANGCANEADHVHNLPNLIENFSRSGLRYYMDVYRPEYLRLFGDTGRGKLFESAWKALDEYVASEAN